MYRITQFESEYIREGQVRTHKSQQVAKIMDSQLTGSCLRYMTPL
jgi:hypothetical protein